MYLPGGPSVTYDGIAIWALKRENVTRENVEQNRTYGNDRVPFYRLSTAL